MASASAFPSGSVNPPSIRMAWSAPEMSTGARKNPCSPAGKCFQVNLEFAAIVLLAPNRAVATPATDLINDLLVVMGVTFRRLDSGDFQLIHQRTRVGIASGMFQHPSPGTGFGQQGGHTVGAKFPHQ